ncbi:DUF262 domain-containing protein [Candidatus Avelusimicrobium fimicolum]|uniref:DUF262 domain-containing protein n=1 Tax=Candidatus Avelusimicrobium fimicolum TaxID=3416216 RepID=UPI003D0C8704
MPTMQVSAEAKSISEIFSKFFSIPAYQRDYVWREENIEAFFNDILESFNSNANKDYFMGNLLLARHPENSASYFVIDGQQRLTTSYILLKLFLDFSKEYGTENEQFYIKLSLCNPTSRGLQYKITFLYEQTQKLMDEFIRQETLEDSLLFISKVHKMGSCSQSEYRMLEAYRHFSKLLKEQFAKNNILDWSSMYEYISYFQQHVIFSVIYTENTQDALVLFQNMNDRGVSLTKTDLLKNLLFQHLKANTLVENEKNLSLKWREFVKTIEKSKNMNITPDRFLRHYIMVKTGRSDIQKGNVFNEIADKKDILNIRQNPIEAFDDILEKAKLYVNIRAYGKRTSAGKEIQGLLNMQALKVEQQVLLLLDTEKMPDDVFEDFSSKIENLLFVYMVSGVLTKQYESLFCRWSYEDIQYIDSKEKYEKFLNEKFLPELYKNKKVFEERFNQLSQQGLVKYKQKYILGKLAQFLEQKRGEFKSLHDVMKKYKEIEHIWPQEPNEAVKQACNLSPEDYAAYMQRLGNLTLLNKKLNIQASNAEFSVKVPYYENEDLLLTKCLVKNLDCYGKPFANCLQSYHISPFTSWNAHCIEARQRSLTSMALTIWGLNKK